MIVCVKCGYEAEGTLRKGRMYRCPAAGCDGMIDPEKQPVILRFDLPSFWTEENQKKPDLSRRRNKGREEAD